MNRVFISRPLAASSTLLTFLSRQNCTVDHFSLLRFEAVPFTAVPAVDWIFFYSPRGVRYFFDQQPAWGTARLAAIGPATAQAIQQRGHSPTFTGTGDPETTAAAFGALAAGQQVLFPQARHSRQSIQRALAGQINAHSLIVYENIAKEGLELPLYRLAILTSPKNAVLFFEQAVTNHLSGVIAIGSATAQAIRDAGWDQPVIAPTPSESGLLDAVKTFFLRKNHDQP